MGQPTRHTLFAPTLYMFLFLGATYEKKSTTKKRPLFHRLRRRAPCMQKHYSSIYTLISFFSFRAVSVGGKQNNPHFLSTRRLRRMTKKNTDVLLLRQERRHTSILHIVWLLYMGRLHCFLICFPFSSFSSAVSISTTGRFLSLFAGTCRVDIRP